ncbi:MAG: hypothetical protein IJV16_02685 [Lachnospiraceae bacterium]|nr:hypothetical protein [Lachnospiraceae bacterium]
MKRIKYYHNMITILCAASLLCSNVLAYADEAVSDNSISGNSISGNSISENETPSVSEDVITGVSVSCTNEYRKKGRTAIISISANSTGGGIALIQVRNVLAGVRKTLYRSDDMTEDKEADRKNLTFPVTANGSYEFFIYDTNGNSDSCRCFVKDITSDSLDYYLSKAEDNRQNSTRTYYDIENDQDSKEEKLFGTVVFGGSGGTGDVRTGNTGERNYVVSSIGEDRSEERTASEKYGDWSMLRAKESNSGIKAWYEPYTDDGEPAQRPQPMENIIDLSDYGVELFKTEVIRDTEDVLGETKAPERPADPDLKFDRPDDNIDNMNDNNRIIIIGIIIFIIILVMLIIAFLLLKSGGAKKKKNKKRVKVRLRSTGKQALVPSGTRAAGTKKTQKLSDVKKMKAVGGGNQARSEVILKTAGTVSDDGIEKYAKMTEDYLRSKQDTEVKRAGLKKYFSDRHGFYCVDFTYKITEGMSPGQFKAQMNDLDTALSNVSGVDTITFAVDNANGVYRTTFYQV